MDAIFIVQTLVYSGFKYLLFGVSLPNIYCEDGRVVNGNKRGDFMRFRSNCDECPNLSQVSFKSNEKGCFLCCFFSR